MRRDSRRKLWSAAVMALVIYGMSAGMGIKGQAASFAFRQAETLTGAAGSEA